MDEAVMQFEPMSIAGMFIVRTQPIGDTRGQLTRIFCEREFAELRPSIRFVQTNIARTSRRGTVRGMHYQRAPAAEAKLVRCLRGRVFDVTVDLRHGSPTWLRWQAIELDAEAEIEVFLPEGCAHGFQALSDDCELLYHHTALYSPAHYGGVRPEDPTLAIRWPLPIAKVSARDRTFPLIDDDFSGVEP